MKKILTKLAKVFGYKDKLEIVQKYKSYEEYLEHQAKKTTDPARRKKWLGEEWEIKLNYFETSFHRYKDQFFKADFEKAIGLGARTGQEVQAFKNLGYDAIGIDIVPCEPLVIKGDIHNIPFDEASFDIVFTNIFDHSLKPEKFASEIERILKPNGMCVLHLAIDTSTDPFGVLEIEDSSAVINLFKRSSVILNQEMKEWGGLNWELILCKR